MGIKSKLKSAGRYVSSSVTGKGRVKEYKLSDAELDKVKVKYAAFENKPKGAAKKELNIMLKGRGLSPYGQNTVKGKINAMVRSERTSYKAKNMKGQTRDFQNKAQAERWAKGTTYAGTSEVSKAKAKPETKDFQKTAGSKATVGIDVVKPRTRSQAKEATTEKIFTKKELDAKPVTDSTAGAPRAKSEEVKIDGEIKTSGKTSEVKEERSQAPRPSRGMREKNNKGKSWKRFVPFTESRRKYKLDKRRKAVAKAEEEDEVASREEELNITRTRRRARLSEAKGRKSEADRFKRGYI